MKPTLQAIAATVGAAGLWAGLAAWDPTTNYHLAPALVVSSGPALLAGRGRAHGSPIGAVIGSTIVATAMLLSLRAVGVLRGPTIGTHNVVHEGLTVILTTAAAWLTAAAVQHWRRHSPS